MSELINQSIHDEMLTTSHLQGIRLVDENVYNYFQYFPTGDLNFSLAAKTLICK